MRRSRLDLINMLLGAADNHGKAFGIVMPNGKTVNHSLRWPLSPPSAMERRSSFSDELDYEKLKPGEFVKYFFFSGRLPGHQSEWSLRFKAFLGAVLLHQGCMNSIYLVMTLCRRCCCTDRIKTGMNRSRPVTLTLINCTKIGTARGYHRRCPHGRVESALLEQRHPRRSLFLSTESREACTYSICQK